MYVYSETGILCEKIDYRDITEIHGKPMAVSENGKNMLFIKCQKSNNISICEISYKGVTPIMSKINIKNKIQDYIDNLPESFLDHEFMSKIPHYRRQIRNFWKNYLKRL